MACNSCNKGTGVEYNESFSCMYCKEIAIAQPRCQIEIELDDGTGPLVASMFGEIAETVFECLTLQFMLHTAEDDIENIEIIAKLPLEQEFVLNVQAATHEFRGESRRRFNVLSVQEASGDAE